MIRNSDLGRIDAYLLSVAQERKIWAGERRARRPAPLAKTRPFQWGGPPCPPRKVSVFAQRSVEQYDLGPELVIH
jgi:hypothetical protein